MFLLYVIPAILLFFIVHLLFPKRFRPVVIIGVLLLAFLPSEVTFLICLFLLICAILAGFLALCFFVNELINLDESSPSLPTITITPPPEDTPIITITPPTEPHVTNLPPGYYQQDPVFLMVIPIPRKRKVKSRSRSPNGRRGSR